MIQEIRVTVEPWETDRRIDRFLADRLEGFTRTAITRLIKNGNVLLHGGKIPPSHHTKAAEEYVILPVQPEETEIAAEDIPLDIVYEDENIVVVNKKAGMVVHPAKGNYTGTLVNALLHHCRNLSGIGGKIRPGIVHRLDKDTSGLIVVAKNDRAHNSLSRQIISREMGREYLAVARGGFLEAKGIIDKPIGRHPKYRKKMSTNSKNPKEAVTEYEALENFDEATLLKVKLQTGRTHQIRVHLSSINHPLLGDAVYGKRKSDLIKRPALHAVRLKLVHPATEEKMEFSAPEPEDFRNLVRELRRKSES